MQQEKRLKRKGRLQICALATAITITGAALLIRVPHGSEAEEEKAALITVRQYETDMPILPEGVPMYDTYEYPFNTMSQDWSSEDVKGYCYHEMTETAKEAGGQFPVIMQVYTYIVCKHYGVDYEVVFALIEKESSFRWDLVAEGEGYMQIVERCHEERMKSVGASDLLNPFQNIRVGVDYLAELKKETGNDWDMLTAYKRGLEGAERSMWREFETGYNREIMDRARELKQEKERLRNGAVDN